MGLKGKGREDPLLGVLSKSKDQGRRGCHRVDRTGTVTLAWLKEKTGWEERKTDSETEFA